MLIRPFLLAIVIAALLPGCASAPKQAVVLVPEFGTLAIDQVAVAPVFFADEPLDWYFGERVATELRRNLLDRLESKGYETSLVGETLVRRSPPGRELSSLAPVPASADAVLVVRIDHFLVAGLYDRVVNSFLELYATAALIDGNGRVLWQDTGVGRGSRGSVHGLDPLEALLTPADLAHSLLTTIPPAG
jgi:hypothetical protein